MVQWPATKVSMMGAVDNEVGGRQQSREGCKNQPSMGASGKQWLATMRVRRQQWWQNGVAAGGGIAVAKEGTRIFGSYPRMF
jgi:hypothetical protein